MEVTANHSCLTVNHYRHGGRDDTIAGAHALRLTNEAAGSKVDRHGEWGETHIVVYSAYVTHTHRCRMLSASYPVRYHLCSMDKR